MSKERMMILEMLKNGKITPADAQVLLRALGEEDTGDLTAAVEVEDLHSTEMNQPAAFQQPLAESLPHPRPAPHTVISAIARVLTKAPAARDHRRRYPDPSYAVAMKRAGLDFSIDHLQRMQEEDIEPEQAARMARASRPEWTTDEIVEMLLQGACPDVLDALNKIGFEGLSPRDVIELSENDVDPHYLERFRGIPMHGLTARDLIAYAEHDVDPELVVALKEISLATTPDITRAAENDLSPSFIRKTAQLMPGVTVRQLIELSDNDVSPADIEGLDRAGFTNLTIKQIIRLHENEVDSEDAVWFREKLDGQITPDDLVRLANHDIRRDYVEPLLQYHLPDLTVDTLIDMFDHDVSVEDAELAQELYGEEITTSHLIHIADNR